MLRIEAPEAALSQTADQRTTGWLDDELLPRVYNELRRVAAQCLRRDRGGHTLQPTALVHEVYLRLAGSGPLVYETPTHLIRIVARMMRQILVEYARRRNAVRRGSGISSLPLIESALPCLEASQETIFLDTALEALEKEDARKSRIIELHYFAGFTTEDIGRLTGLSARTVKREMKAGYAWLYSWFTGGALSG